VFAAGVAASCPQCKKGLEINQLIFYFLTLKQKIEPMKTKLFILCVLLFRVASAQYTKLHDFNDSPNGAIPYGSLVSEGTFFYGMTWGGGNGFGTLFSIKPNGTGYASVHDFAGGSNGRSPNGSLISDGTFLYGMTWKGGLYDEGIVFKVKLNGTGFTKLHEFVGAPNDGAQPYGSLISDGTFLYGMTSKGGGNDEGTLFKIKPDGTAYANVLDFSFGNGSGPQGSLISDGTFLYGMTRYGGTTNDGAVFKIKPDGTGYAMLVNFNDGNGSHPLGSLISDGTFLYGMTEEGGTSDSGTVFKVKPDGSGYAKLIDFAGSSNGKSPKGDLIFDGTFLYGMTALGGINDKGTVFKIKPDGAGYTRLYDFNDGYEPNGSLISDGTSLYGMTLYGGTDDLGTVFKFNPNVTVGMPKNTVAAALNVYPNPCSTSATLRTDKPFNNASLAVDNCFGQTVAQIENLSGQTVTFDRNNLPGGLYFIRLTEKGKIIAVNKIIIGDK
jgi:uncharacterized repeat protein (TIGR03803 family)